MIRRSFLDFLAGVPVGLLSMPDDEADLEVGVSASFDAVSINGPSPIREACKAIGKALRAALPNCDVRVSFAEIVVVDGDDVQTSEDAMRWWYDEREPEHDVELLMVPYDDSWEYNGWAIDDETHAVCHGAELMDNEAFQTIAIHEVGHVLGLGHEDATKRGQDSKHSWSPMSVEAIGDRDKEFSAGAKRKLRRRYG